MMMISISTVSQEVSYSWTESVSEFPEVSQPASLSSSLDIQVGVLSPENTHIVPGEGWAITNLVSSNDASCEGNSEYKDCFVECSLLSHYESSNKLWKVKT